MLRGRTAGVIHPTVRHLISIGNSLSHAVESISSILPRLCAAPIGNMELLVNDHKDAIVYSRMW
jgi:hypothetical protein